VTKIFISHSSKDQEITLRLIDMVLARCLQVDRLDDIYCTSRQGEIEAGKDFLQDIYSNLSENCKIILLLLSNNYFDSPFCMTELGASWMLNKQEGIKIIPLMMPGTDRKILERTPLRTLQVYLVDIKEDLVSLIDNISSGEIPKITSTSEIILATSKFVEQLASPNSEEILDQAFSSILHAFDNKLWSRAIEFADRIQKEILPAVRREKYEDLCLKFNQCKSDQDRHKVWQKYEELKDEYGNFIDQENILIKIHPVTTYLEKLALANGNPEIRRALLTIADPNTGPTERKYIGDELQKVGDIRQGVGINKNGIPEIDWIAIPKGKFLFGPDQEIENITRDYKISRYLTTNLQFRTFLESEDLATWLEACERKNKDEFSLGIDNHPVVSVSWLEARAFCKWLSQKINSVIQLPTHFQWQKAARGNKGRIYAYGNNADTSLGNTVENSLGGTIAVGMFPFGSSPYGLLDISGNVWEWTYTIDSKRSEKSELEKRVLTGGSFNYACDRDRVYSHSAQPETYRSERGGFRISQEIFQVQINFCFLPVFCGSISI
jgi:formylglycine-generating enzyme required for sulfatase activity